MMRNELFLRWLIQGALNEVPVMTQPGCKRRENGRTDGLIGPDNQ